MEDPKRQAIRRVMASGKKPERAIYSAVFLEDPKELMRWWESNVGSPLHPKAFSHHMTIKYKPDPDEVTSLPIGSLVRLKIVGWAEDERGQAVVVEPHGVRSTNAIPHITVATNGAPPSYSNELLERGWDPARGSLSGRVGYKGTKGSEVFDLTGTVYDL